MKRSPEYQRFLDIHYGKVADPDPVDLETEATADEMEWWLRQKIWEKRQKAQNGKANREELIFLANRGYYYPTTPEEYKPRGMRKNKK